MLLSLWICFHILIFTHILTAYLALYSIRSYFLLSLLSKFIKVNIVQKLCIFRLSSLYLGHKIIMSKELIGENIRTSGESFVTCQIVKKKFCLFSFGKKERNMPQMLDIACNVDRLMWYSWEKPNTLRRCHKYSKWS